MKSRRWRRGWIVVSLAATLLVPTGAATQVRSDHRLVAGADGHALEPIPRLPTGSDRFHSPTWRSRAITGALVGCGGVGLLVASNAQKGEKLAAAVTGCALGLVPGAILGVTFLHSAPGVAAGIRLPM